MQKFVIKMNGPKPSVKLCEQYLFNTFLSYEIKNFELCIESQKHKQMLVVVNDNLNILYK